MNAPETLLRDSLYLAQTHEVTNVSRELVDYNPYTQDTALVDGVAREGGGWAHDTLTAFGQLTGSAEEDRPAQTTVAPARPSATAMA